SLPETLKAQRTHADMLYAVTTLVSILKSNAGEPWVDDIMSGQFGTLAPKLEKALNDLISANIALARARRRRRNAYGPAYTGYMAFKHVVRNMLGPSSPEYRLLHQRAGSEGVEPDEQAEPADEEAPDSGVMPASKGTPVLANEPASVKTG